MLKFEDLESQVNPELQDKLHRAQDEVNEKKDQVRGLKELITKAESALEADRKAAADADDKVKRAHIGHGGDADAIEASMKSARDAKGQAVAKVQQGQDRIDDLKQGYGYAVSELKELEKARNKARLHVLRHLMMATKFAQRPGEKSRLSEIESIPVADMILTYMLHHECGPGGINIFAGEVTHPSRLFGFIAQYFAVPTEEEFNRIRGMYDYLVWGDYDTPLEGGRGKMPPNTSSPLNWDNINHGVS